ncbi:MAG: S-adenosylmethionine:tRNA ribosyltransferase-isomerase [Candidatus Kapaibacterium sp.]|nr:MAG: S-adenosylmethionine:tRNA ribosyltransferase-isomerase [Candidatus Kapabacteria bacterium]
MENTQVFVTIPRKCTSLVLRSYTQHTQMSQSSFHHWIPAVETASVDYDLPIERIAQQPLPVRDESRLLRADARSGRISHHIFHELPTLLPEDAFLVRNTTRVLPARIFARKPTGGYVELLLVSPADGSPPDCALATNASTWECLIGGKRIREGMVLEALHDGDGICAAVRSINGMFAHVEITCLQPTSTLAEQLSRLGQLPLPPYIRRRPTASDSERYQTVYARWSGSVAAPTAGLHFTERLLTTLHAQGTEIVDVVLHVGPGTFQPLRAEDASHHTMHAERIHVERSSIEQLQQLTSQKHRLCVCVGTTSVRTIETLYWLGVKLLAGEDSLPTMLTQEVPYTPSLAGTTISPAEAFGALLDWLDRQNAPALDAATQLYIVPGYRYRVVQALITNFHQPRSTLLLLVAALIGPWWRTIYAEALSHGYRFLSYGDASLLIADPASAPLT